MKANVLIAAWAGALTLAPLQAIEAQRGRVAEELVALHRIEIDRPAKAIWPHILDTSTWKRGNRLEHVSGERGQVGEVFASIPRDGMSKPEYYVQTVELTPPWRRTNKLYGRGRDAPLIGYSSWELEEEGGKTILSYRVFTEVLLRADFVKSHSADQLRAHQREYSSKHNARFKSELQALKEMLEGASHPNVSTPQRGRLQQ